MSTFTTVVLILAILVVLIAVAIWMFLRWMRRHGSAARHRSGPRTVAELVEMRGAEDKDVPPAVMVEPSAGPAEEPTAVPEPAAESVAADADADDVAADHADDAATADVATDAPRPPSISPKGTDTPWARGARMTGDGADDTSAAWADVDPPAAPAPDPADSAPARSSVPGVAAAAAAGAGGLAAVLAFRRAPDASASEMPDREGEEPVAAEAADEPASSTAPWAGTADGVPADAAWPDDDADDSAVPADEPVAVEDRNEVDGFGAGAEAPAAAGETDDEAPAGAVTTPSAEEQVGGTADAAQGVAGPAADEGAGAAAEKEPEVAVAAAGAGALGGLAAVGLAHRTEAADPEPVAPAGADPTDESAADHDDPAVDAAPTEPERTDGAGVAVDGGVAGLAAEPVDSAEAEQAAAVDGELATDDADGAAPDEERGEPAADEATEVPVEESGGIGAAAVAAGAVGVGGLAVAGLADRDPEVAEAGEPSAGEPTDAAAEDGEAVLAGPEAVGDDASGGEAARGEAAGDVTVGDEMAGDETVGDVTAGGDSAGDETAESDTPDGRAIEQESGDGAVDSTEAPAQVSTDHVDGESGGGAGVAAAAAGAAVVGGLAAAGLAGRGSDGSPDPREAVDEPAGPADTTGAEEHVGETVDPAEDDPTVAGAEWSEDTIDDDDGLTDEEREELHAADPGSSTTGADIAAVHGVTAETTTQESAAPETTEERRPRRTPAEMAAEHAAVDVALLRTFGVAEAGDRPGSAPIVSLSAAGSHAGPRAAEGPSVPVTVRVLGRDDEPVAGASAALVDDRGVQVATAVTGAAGSVELPAPVRSTYMVVASADQHQPGAVAVAVGDGPAEATVPLVRSSSVAGSVWGAEVAIAGAQVALLQDGEIVAEVESGRDGGFRIPDLTAGGYTLTVTAPEHEQRTVQLVVPVATDVRHDVDLEPSSLVGTSPQVPSAH